MKIKKIVSAVLCVAVIAGFAGCTESKKPTNESLISSVVNEYGEALEDFDGKAVLDLTKWNKGCENYTKTKELLDITLYDTDIQSCYRTIASTIKLDYKIADIEVKDKKASLELTYKMVDWESVFYDENGFSGYEEVVDALRLVLFLMTASGRYPRSRILMKF